VLSLALLKQRGREVAREKISWLVLFPVYFFALIFLIDRLVLSKLEPSQWQALDQLFDHSTLPISILLFVVAFQLDFKRTKWHGAEWLCSKTSLNAARLLVHVLEFSFFFMLATFFLLFESGGITPNLQFFGTLWFAFTGGMALKIFMERDLSSTLIQNKSISFFLLPKKILTAFFNRLLSLLIIKAKKDMRFLLFRDLSAQFRGESKLFLSVLFFHLFGSYLSLVFRPHEDILRIHGLPFYWFVLQITCGYFYGIAAHRIFRAHWRFFWIDHIFRISHHQIWQARIFSPMLLASAAVALQGIGMAFLFAANLSAFPLNSIPAIRVFHLLWIPVGIAALCGALAFEGNKKHTFLNSMVTLLATLAIGFVACLHEYAFFVVPLFIHYLHEALEWRMGTLEPEKEGY
jgi:hypothetical protein